MEFEVNKVIKKLKNDKYPLFVSEKDLQLRFAITAKELYPKLLFYPEYPIYDESNNKQDHLDLVIFDETANKYCIIEFKYVLKTGFTKIPGNINHKFRNHSAVDIRRYLCYSDISRLERLEIPNNTFKKTTSYFILLSNENKMWECDTTNCEFNKVDKEFSMHDEYTIQPGEHKWRPGCRTGKDKKSIQIKFSHKISWEDYVEAFKQLIIKF